MKYLILVSLFLMGCAGGSGGGSESDPVGTQDPGVTKISELNCQSGSNNRIPGYNNLNSSLWKYSMITYSDGSRHITCELFTTITVRDALPNENTGPFDPDFCFARNNSSYGTTPITNGSWPFTFLFAPGSVKGYSNFNGSVLNPSNPVLQMAPVQNIDSSPGVDDPQLGHCYLKTVFN